MAKRQREENTVYPPDNSPEQRNMQCITFPDPKKTAPHHSPVAIQGLLAEIAPNSTLRIFARSASSWAELYKEIETAINQKNIHVEVVIADHNATMATEADHAVDDLQSSENKFRRIKLSKDTGGSFSLFRNPTFLLFSYVSWETSEGKKKGWLTIGATLNKSRQRSIEFLGPSPIKDNLDDIFEKVAKRSRSNGFMIDYTGIKEILPTDFAAKRVFIGHGRSNVWKDLKDFISDRLNLPWDEFNREAVAGYTTFQRLEDMLHNAGFAFIVMTAEDKHKDSLLHARENVIHEAGLFQGRLGPHKAILLLEESCEEFSNISGLIQIRFPKGDISSKFEEIRKVLEREGVIRA